MSDRNPKTERVFGCGPKDPHARLQGRAIIAAGREQGVSAVDLIDMRKVKTPSVSNLKNR